MPRSVRSSSRRLIAQVRHVPPRAWVAGIVFMAIPTALALVIRFSIGMLSNKEKDEFTRDSPDELIGMLNTVTTTVVIVGAICGTALYLLWKSSAPSASDSVDLALRMSDLERDWKMECERARAEWELEKQQWKEETVRDVYRQVLDQKNRGLLDD